MIVVDKEKCGECGLCVGICHEHCLSLNGCGLTVDESHCSTCTQCVAICPKGAISWNQVPPMVYEPCRLPSPAQLDELFKERRSTRRFKDRAIPRPLLEEVIGYGIYAPTNNYALRAIVVDDKELIAEMDRFIVDFSARIYRAFFRPRFLSAVLERLWPTPDYVLNRPKLQSVAEQGWTFDHKVAAMVFIAGDRRTPLSEASAQYSLYNMILYAQTQGIGSCLWGPGQIFLNRTPAARKLLGIQKQERIYGTLLLGYPAVRFRHKVEGKALPIQWNGV